MIINKIIKYILHPNLLTYRIKWFFFKKRLQNIGKKSWVGKNFSFLNPQFVSIGDNFVGGHNLKIHVFYRPEIGDYPKINIGSNVTFTENIYISCLNSITIGNGVLCGGNVFITDNFHGKNIKEELGTIPNERTLYSKGPVIIGNNVWIGHNVSIMPNVVIGDNCVIGANAVVTKNIPSNCIVAGVPAHVIKIIN